MDGGPLQGKWYLEVKHWPNRTSVSSAKTSIGGQITSHFDRLVEYGGLNINNLAQSPGLVYKIKANAGIFSALEDYIPAKVESVLIKTLNATSTQDMQKIKDYIDRVIVESIS